MDLALKVLLGILGSIVFAWATWSSTTLLAHDRTLAVMEFRVEQIFQAVVPLEKRR